MATKKRSRLPAGVTLRADGRYQVRVSPTDPLTGRRLDRMCILPNEATLAQAVEARDALLAEALGETSRAAVVPTLADYAESWLRRRAAKGLRRKTLETYAHHHSYHLLPYLGEQKIDALERRHIVWWREQIEARIGDGPGKVSSVTARSWWRDGMILIRAALHEYELRDITQHMEPPVGTSTPRRQQETMSREQVDALLSACEGRYAALVRFLARTGCRLGEGAGLRWCDLDLEQGVAYLRQAITEVDSGRSFQRTTPKGKRTRTVGLTADLVEALRAHRVAAPGVGEALVWATRTGLPIRGCYVRRTVASALGRVSSDLGLTPGPQVLRRTMISLGLEAGLDRVLLQSMVGHADDSMTAHYHGLRADTAAGAAAALWGSHVGVGGGEGAPSPSQRGSKG